MIDRTDRASDELISLGERVDLLDGRLARLEVVLDGVAGMLAAIAAPPDYHSGAHEG